MIQPILQFIQAKGSGEASLRRLLSYTVVHGEDATRALCLSANSLVAELGLKSDVAENIVKVRNEAVKLADGLDQQGVQIIWFGSAAYPERLVKNLRTDAPPVLFVQGNSSLFNRPSVGFCGSRKASAKGLEVASLCAAQVVHEGICVVSGYAQGVDMAAHRAAMVNGGTTIFVLAEGVFHFQKKREIADLCIADNHLVVSQFPAECTWSGRNAMKRNSTIIGLSDAMILVESGLTGGTFAAGEETLQRKRPLFVIHFANPAASAIANPYFIEKGGVPIRGNRQGIPTLQNLTELLADPVWSSSSLLEKQRLETSVKQQAISRARTG